MDNPFNDNRRVFPHTNSQDSGSGGAASITSLGSPRTTTVAVYGNQRGVGASCPMQEQRSETRFELRSNAHGQSFGAYVPVK